MTKFAVRRMVLPCVSIVLTFLVICFISVTLMLSPQVEVNAPTVENPAKSVPGSFDNEGNLLDIQWDGEDVIDAYHKWDAQVGCENFRKGLPPLTPARSLQDPNSVKCSDLKQLHVSVLVKEYTWIPDSLNNLYACSCGLTCLWTKSPVLAGDPDANLYELYKPPRKRKSGDPLRVYIDLEAGKARASQDLFISYHAKDDLQATYAGISFHMNRNHYVSAQKNRDVLVYWSSSRCLKDRNDVARSFLPLVSHHSFGKCLNNVGGRDALLEMYPICGEKGGGPSWSQSLHCAMSHYKFVLAIENTRTESYVTEKLFYALDAGSVPIYFGAPNVLDLVPPKSVIIGNDFPSVDDLAAYIKKLANDPLQYAEYHAWRRCGIVGHYNHTRAVDTRNIGPPWYYWYPPWYYWYPHRVWTGLSLKRSILVKRGINGITELGRKSSK